MNRDTVLKPFSFERLGLLVRNRFLDDAPSLAIIAGVVFGVNLLGLLTSKTVPLNGNFVDPENLHNMAVVIALYGLFLASKAFVQMHNGRGGSDWVLLPATPLEKYLATFLSYALAYPVVAGIGAFLISALSHGICFALKGSIDQSLVFDPLSLAREEYIVAYLYVVSFAMAGSARFAKMPLLKTLGIAVAWFLAFSTIFSVLVYFLAPNDSQIAVSGRIGSYLSFDFEDGKKFSVSLTDERILEWLVHASVYVSILFANVYGYFCVREKESVDEVQ